MKNMEVWATPDFKSNSSTVAAACMFDKIHSVGMKKITNLKLNKYVQGHGSTLKL